MNEIVNKMLFLHGEIVQNEKLATQLEDAARAIRCGNDLRVAEMDRLQRKLESDKPIETE